MFRKDYFRWRRYGQWSGKGTVMSRLEIKRKILNVEQRDSRKIQAKIVPTITLVINQIMKRIVWYNCDDKGFEHRMLTGKSLNLINWAGEKEVKEEKELMEVAKSFLCGSLLWREWGNTYLWLVKVNCCQRSVRKSAETTWQIKLQ